MRPKSTEPLKKKHWDEEGASLLFPKGTKQQFYKEVKTTTGKSASSFMRSAALEYAEFVLNESKNEINYLFSPPVSEKPSNELSSDSKSDVIIIENEEKNDTAHALLLATYAQSLGTPKIENYKDRFEYLKNYQKSNYDKATIWFKKGNRQAVIDAASKEGLTTSRFILLATLKKLEMDFGFTTSCLMILLK